MARTKKQKAPELPSLPSKTGSNKARRMSARLAAVQVVYRLAIDSEAQLAKALEDFIYYHNGRELEDGDVLVTADTGLLETLVKDVMSRTAELDRLIDANLSGRTDPNRLELLLRCILRVAAAELTASTETDARIIIKDGLGITDGFYGGKEPQLVNGVLNRLARLVRPHEFDDADGAQTGA